MGLPRPPGSPIALPATSCGHTLPVVIAPRPCAGSGGDVTTHYFTPDGRRRPGETPVRTALSPRLLIRMRSQVQVLAGPPTIPSAHGHLGQSSTLPLPARPTGSCQPCATTSGGRVLRTGRRRLDQLVQGRRDGSVPPSHDVLIAQRRGRGGMPHPHHQLPSARARRNRQGGRRVPQVMEAQPSTPAARVVGIQTRRVKLLRRIGPPRSAENTSPSGPASA
jgi:hypothetical protein